MDVALLFQLLLVFLPLLLGIWISFSFSFSFFLLFFLVFFFFQSLPLSGFGRSKHKISEKREVAVQDE